MYQTIELELDESLAKLTIDRPDNANAMNLKFMQELASATRTIMHDPTVRAVLITGNGRFFSAGGDLGSFAEDMDAIAPKLQELAMHLHVAISNLARLKCPVIAAVNGPCAGAAVGLVSACDLVLAAENASFTIAYPGIGFSPDGGTSWLLPRRIGDLRTRELMFTNRKLGATEAKEWGLVNSVLPGDNLHAEAEALAKQMATGPTQAFARMKALLADSFEQGLEKHLELEARSLVQSTATEDGKEGVTAFIEKRQPRFTGT